MVLMNYNMPLLTYTFYMADNTRSVSGGIGTNRSFNPLAHGLGVGGRVALPEGDDALRGRKPHLPRVALTRDGRGQDARVPRGG